MDINLKLIPEGNLPYSNVELCEQMIRKLYFNIPFIAELPLINKSDTTIQRTISGLKSIKQDKNSLILDDVSEEHQRTIELLNDVYNNLGKESLENFAIKAPFLETYENMLKEFRPKFTILKLTGIFSLMHMVNNIDPVTILSDKAYRKFFIQAVTAKALWFIEKVRELSPKTTPIIKFEEHLLNTFSSVKRSSNIVSDDTITILFSKVFQKLKAEGAVICVQSFEKCNWIPVLESAPDMISFAAYTNPNNLNIIPAEVNEYLSKGGHINWAIVPVNTERAIKDNNADLLERKTIKTMEDLISCGVSSQLVYQNASVSLQGHLGNIPLFFAEKAHIMVKQLSTRIPTGIPQPHQPQ